MASKKTNKRKVNKAVKTAKKHPKVVIGVVIFLVIVIAVAAVLYLKVDKVHDAVDNLVKGALSTQEAEGGNNALSGGGSSSGGNSSGSGSLPGVKTYGDKAMTFYFLELGNNNTGDSVYIKAGDVDILIDAGSKEKDSADDIESAVDQLCGEDRKLEYVIVTHAHEDHIAGFVDGAGDDGEGIFQHYECETIIEFAKTNQKETTSKGNRSLYGKYLDARNAEVAQGAVCYTALQCYNNEGGAQRVYELGEGMSMTILYQKYYEQDASSENNYSVCVLFKHGDKNYLFTGDLEGSGENSLMQENDLPEVDLYKAGHHGSGTSSTKNFLAKIKPKIICICCCCGAVEYTQDLNNTFPYQATIDRIAPYTDKVYVTTLGSIAWGVKNDGKEGWLDVGASSMNGLIAVISNGGEISVECSNNDTLLKDTEWFKAYRTMPEAWAAAPPE